MVPSAEIRRILDPVLSSAEYRAEDGRVAILGKDRPAFVVGLLEDAGPYGVAVVRAPAEACTVPPVAAPAHRNGDPDSYVAQAPAQIETIASLIEDDLPERAWEKARGFFEDVAAKVLEVGQTIERTGRVTEAQQQALDNWEAAVVRWIHRELD